jgi:pimeloyl-ACP methyl ester carboxylesterase
MTTDLSPIDGVYFSFVKADGIVHRLASTERNLTKGGAAFARSQGYPLIIFLHGFPESWYSWRHQLLCLRDRPVLAVAPDMRGYGSTSQPVSVEAYTQPVLAKDVLEIAKALGYNKFIVVGHDWGCALAWSVALLYQEHVSGVCGMSVPYAGTPKKGLLSMLQAAYGECLDPYLPRETMLKARFHYMLHHGLPRCAEEYNKNVREFLYRIFAYRPGCDVEEGTPEHDVHSLMFPRTGDENHDNTRTLDATAAPGLWLRIPRPMSLPNWLTQQDLEYFYNEFEKAGFHGGLCWYQAADKNFQLMKELLRKEDGGYDDKIRPPSLFLIGQDDSLIKFYGGREKVTARLKSNLFALTREPIFLEGCGHWIQQEKPEVVNHALLRFIDDVTNMSLPRQSKL